MAFANNFKTEGNLHGHPHRRPDIDVPDHRGRPGGSRHRRHHLAGGRYGNENATVTVNGLSFDGGPSSTNINLQLATGISSITLLGTAPINVIDGPDANSVVGNDGDNIISVSSGVESSPPETEPIV